MNDQSSVRKPASRAEVWIAVVLVACAGVVAIWEIMADRSQRPFQTFELTGEDFRDFTPVSGDWAVRPREVGVDPTEPNILALELRRRNGAAISSAPILVRLVHGYNMRDCMRIKGYEVELIEDRRRLALSSPDLLERRDEAGKIEDEGNDSREKAQNSRKSEGQVQIWRLISASGDASIWVTSMLRSGDFGESSLDVRSMAFPRIGVPDDPGWIPQGMTWRSLRHPIRNFRSALRAKWNNSRRDLLTFLGLRQPAWASEDLLTLVAAYRGPSVGPEFEKAVEADVLKAHAFVYSALRDWHSRRTGPR